MFCQSPCWVTLTVCGYYRCSHPLETLVALCPWKARAGWLKNIASYGFHTCWVHRAWWQWDGLNHWRSRYEQDRHSFVFNYFDKTRYTFSRKRSNRLRHTTRCQIEHSMWVARTPKKYWSTSATMLESNKWCLRIITLVSALPYLMKFIGKLSYPLHVINLK